MRGTRPYPRHMTEKQAAVWKFFSDFQHDYGYPPTYRDVMRELGYKSVQSVAEHIKPLLRKGFLRRLNVNAKTARGIIAVNGDSGVCPMCGQHVTGGDPVHVTKI